VSIISSCPVQQLGRV